MFTPYWQLIVNTLDGHSCTNLKLYVHLKEPETRQTHKKTQNNILPNCASIHHVISDLMFSTLVYEPEVNLWLENVTSAYAHCALYSVNILVLFTPPNLRYTGKSMPITIRY